MLLSHRLHKNVVKPSTAQECCQPKQFYSRTSCHCSQDVHIDAVSPLSSLTAASLQSKTPQQCCSSVLVSISHNAHQGSNKPA
eukprot:5425995-Lingulodinium_polyedra.AAC.1